MNNTLQRNDEARPEMDDLLHDYFQAEMPHPWPAFTPPRSLRMKPAVSFWSRYSGRVALAACIGLMVAGYLTLGGYFPTSQGPTDMQKAAGDIGLRDKAPKSLVPAPQIEDPMPTPMDEVTKHKTK